jgi:Holliday junction DNA helicase RuvA
MIAYISGKIIESHPASCLVLTDWGVWYEIFINESIFSKISTKDTISMYIYHHITEWQQSLFWFLEPSEKVIFTELIKISGIWWKVALNIINLGLENLSRAIMLEDNRAIESIKWIWKKMAEKVILELKDKDFISMYESAWVPSSWKSVSKPEAQIVETLTNMWYNKDAIMLAMQNVPEGLEGLDEILPHIIKEL